MVKRTVKFCTPSNNCLVLLQCSIYIIEDCQGSLIILFFTVLTDEERHEKKRLSAALYQNYLHRAPPKHLGAKEIPEV